MKALSCQRNKDESKDDKTKTSTLPIRNEGSSSKNKSSNNTEGIRIWLKSNDIIRNIHSVNREKRSNNLKFKKINNDNNLIFDNNPVVKKVSNQTNFQKIKLETNKITGEFYKNNYFLANPIEILRQERLRRETLKKIKIQKKKEKFNELDANEIKIEKKELKPNFQLDYSGANIKMRLLNDLYIWETLEEKENRKETQEFIDWLLEYDI